MGTVVINILISICVVAAVFGLYFLMIMPRIWKRPDSKPFCKVLYAHRGLHNNKTEAPENSMEAFRRAVEAGYGIEMDIQLTKDKIPVVFHDFTLKRVCGAEGKVSNYTYEELQKFYLYQSKQTIPKLEEVLNMVDGKVPLIVEFKIELIDTSLCPIADKLLRQYKGLYAIESFNPLGVFWYRCHHKEVMRGQLADAFNREKEYRGVLFFLLENLLFNCLTRPDFVAYNHKYANMLSRKICHKWYHNIAAAWTIKSEKELTEAKKNFDIYIFDSFLPKQGCEEKESA